MDRSPIDYCKAFTIAQTCPPEAFGTVQRWGGVYAMKTARLGNAVTTSPTEHIILQVGLDYGVYLFTKQTDTHLYL